MAWSTWSLVCVAMRAKRTSVSCGAQAGGITEETIIKVKLSVIRSVEVLIFLRYTPTKKGVFHYGKGNL